MMLLLIFTAVTLLVLAMLLAPLLRQPVPTPARMQYDLAVYRDQLAEIDKDIERSLITEGNADGARAEIHRRMLAAGNMQTLSGGMSVNRGSQRVIALAIAIILPLGTGLMYWHLGAPGLPGQPLAERKDLDSSFTLAVLAAKLTASLKDTPDAVGYRKLAETEFLMRHYEAAAEACRKAIDLGADDAGIWAELGETLTLANDHIIIHEALKAFQRAYVLEPANAQARFYLGLASAQAHELRQAVAIWRDLEKDAPADAPWLGMVKENITFYAKEGGFTPESVSPKAPVIDRP